MTFQGSYGRQIERGDDTKTTNASGFATFTFTKAFPTGYVPVVIAEGAATQAFVTTTPTNTGFTAQFYTVAGTLLASTSVRCYWIAI